MNLADELQRDAYTEALITAVIRCATALERIADALGSKGEES